MDIVEKALNFATDAHKGQKRKYTGEDYICHPIAVCEIVRSVDHNKPMLAAALLHDTVEDTKTTINDIEREFGGIVSAFVEGMTDISKPKDGNRATRKEIDRMHLKDALPPVHTIKLADLIDNSDSIMKYDSGFAKVYIAEKKLLLDVLIYGSPVLHARAVNIVADYLNK